MIYISAPYTHPDSTVIDQRMEEVHKHFLKLASEMRMAVSPLIVGHQYIKSGMWTGSHDFWLPYSDSMLRTCSELHVLRLDGWRQSLGVQFEIQLARRLEMPITYF